MKRGIFITVALGLLLLLVSLPVQGQLAFHRDPLYFPLSQHRMTDEVCLECGTPVARSTFTPDDVEAISWLKVWRNHRDHPVEWRWYSPDGHVYHRTFGVIPAIDAPLGHWGSCIWSSLMIDGYEVSIMPGTWKVDVIVDFKKELTQYFNIGRDNQVPCL